MLHEWTPRYHRRPYGHRHREKVVRVRMPARGLTTGVNGARLAIVPSIPVGQSGRSASVGDDVSVQVRPDLTTHIAH